jgi:hypothetical protein
MKTLLKILVITILLPVMSTMALSEEVSREQIKGLDEQVQEIKTDVLSIATELSQLEEKLLFPSNTQVALFVSIAKGETFRLDAVEIQLDGQQVAHHIYTFKELEALQKGGVQRIYTGNLRTGIHDLQVAVIGKTPLGGNFRETKDYKVDKGMGPKIVEISLASQSINFKDQ